MTMEIAEYFRKSLILIVFIQIQALFYFYFCFHLQYKNDYKLNRKIIECLQKDDVGGNLSHHIIKKRQTCTCGPPGLPGPRGYPGHKGEQGLQGFSGPPGLTGSKGHYGTRGLPGEKGEKGNFGIPGPVGVSGRRGEVGEKGEKGEIGPIGAPGLRGSRGLQGPPGEKGSIGFPGSVGSKGDVGFQGPPGNIGLRGVPGEKGESGQQGIPGILGLVGATGPPGLRGAPGFAGSRGEKGDSGKEGEQGMPGVSGRPGISGDKGDKGEKGEVGIQGIQGFRGQKGFQGERGPPGIQGIKGDLGFQGPSGFSGKSGRPGEKGDKGNQGLQEKQGLQCLCGRRLNKTHVVNKYGPINYNTLPGRNLSCILHEPQYLEYTKTTDKSNGQWLKDVKPKNNEEQQKIWIINNKNYVLEEYTNQELVLSQKINRSYDLYNFGDVNINFIYEGILFSIIPSKKPTIIKHFLSNYSNKMLSIVELSNLDLQTLYKQQSNYLDFAVDELGTWIIFSVPFSDNTGVLKFNTESLNSEYVWNITINHKNFDKIFITHGILYAMVVENDFIFIPIAVDLYQSHFYHVNIALPKPSEDITNFYYDYQVNAIIMWNQLYRWSIALRCIDMEESPEQVPVE